MARVYVNNLFNIGKLKSRISVYFGVKYVMLGWDFQNYNGKPCAADPSGFMNGWSFRLSLLFLHLSLERYK